MRAAQPRSLLHGDDLRATSGALDSILSQLPISGIVMQCSWGNSSSCRLCRSTYGSVANELLSRTLPRAHSGAGPITIAWLACRLAVGIAADIRYFERGDLPNSSFNSGMNNPK